MSRGWLSVLEGDRREVWSQPNRCEVQAGTCLCGSGVSGQAGRSVRFESVPGEPDAGLTHFLSTPHLSTRPRVFPLHLSHFLRRNRVRKKSNKPPLVGESVSWRAASSGSAHSREAQYMLCVGRKTRFLGNYSEHDGCLFRKPRKCCNKKTVQLEKQMLEQTWVGGGGTQRAHLCRRHSCREKNTTDTSVTCLARQQIRMTCATRPPPSLPPGETKDASAHGSSPEENVVL